MSVPQHVQHVHATDPSGQAVKLWQRPEDARLQFHSHRCAICQGDVWLCSRPGCIAHEDDECGTCATAALDTWMTEHHDRRPSAAQE